ncbi:hypothetical protein HPP92_019142 [Vanilla planifolia]|uniref:Uncharacterized protein n=1 Tax=Vanilla planifolia TaxID=51239 RepID=A0A835UKP2_VANPL|nr:hypothetical protein HPP92_019660 [Vanilla planifolia]KAG0464978.1 hypothetical protein HPP92_019142 [Vanilla planifolia]
MGSCFSTTATSAAPADLPQTARVIDIDGKLVEYSASFSVADVLGQNQSSCFLCNSDTLFYGRFIHALGREELLEPGRLYFVLPASMLQYRLTAADMAALALTASSALATTACTRKRWKKNVVHVMQVTAAWDVVEGYKEFNEASVGYWRTCLAEKRPVPVKKRSPRLRLSPIEEVAE